MRSCSFRSIFKRIVKDPPYNSHPMDTSSIEDTLVKKILETHVPDGCYIDPLPLLCLTENTIRFVIASIVPPPPTHTAATAVYGENDGTKIVVKEKEIGYTIHRISREMLRNNRRDTDKHKTTMALLGLVEGYAWNVKTVLVLAAVGVSYAEFALILQLSGINPLALSLMLLKQLQNISAKMKGLKGYFKALTYLVEEMIKVSKCIIKFESHHPDYISMDIDSTAAVKAYIHVAAYWIVRSAVACSSQITSMIAAKKVLSGDCYRHTDFTTARWELWSLATKLDGIHSHLRNLLDACYLQLEEKMQSILLNLFEEDHDDNQKVLHTLLAMKDKLPLKRGPSLEKLSVSNLRNKVVILFISHPQVSIERLLLLTQQLGNCDEECAGRFEVVWIPISRTSPSSASEQRIMEKFTSMLPWYSVHKPCTLSMAVVNYVKEVWFTKEDPVMVVLDANGKLISPDAINMVFIWGAMAYPFSTSRELELWQQIQSWTTGFLMDDIDLTVSSQVEEGKLVGLYGGDNIEWIRSLCTYMKNITKSGIPLKLIYVGCNSNAEGILETIAQEDLSEYLHRIKAAFFWLRLHSMRRSRLSLGHDRDSDCIIREVDSLITSEAISNGWLIVSEGLSTDIITIRGTKDLDILARFQIWGENIEKEGFMNSLRNAINTPEKVERCTNYTLLPYAKDMAEGRVVCNECGRTMEKHIVFECKSTNLTSLE